MEEEIEELQRQIVGRYQNDRARALALTKLDEARLWLGECLPAEEAASLPKET